MIIGLPRMATMSGFRREFTPDFVDGLIRMNLKVFLERGYGSDLGFSEESYDHVEWKDRKEIFTQANIVVFLASPVMEEVGLMKPGQMLMSMLHFSTHPQRNKELEDLGILVISFDEIKDFEGKRIVQDFKSVAWNAISTAFIELKKRLGDKYWFGNTHLPIGVYLLGAGEVGKEAVEACLKIGESHDNSLVEVVPTNSIHSLKKYWQTRIIGNSLLRNGWPHLLVDASRRKYLSETVINEKDLFTLPPETLIVDITADRYDNEGTVKAIQGIPTGDESKYIFEVDDQKWEDKDMVPKQFQIGFRSRRTVLSNYAWAGIGSVQNRIHNIDKYGQQILPFIERFLKMDRDHMEKYDTPYWTIDKSIYQSTLNYHLNTKIDKT